MKPLIESALARRPGRWLEAIVDHMPGRHPRGQVTAIVAVTKAARRWWPTPDSIRVFPTDQEKMHG